MSVNLNNSEAVRPEPVGNSLDAGGLAGTPVAVKQHIICGLSVHKCLCVLKQSLFLDLISYKILQYNIIHAFYGLKFEYILSV